MYLPVCCLLFQKKFWGWDIYEYVLGSKRYMKKFRGMDICIFKAIIIDKNLSSELA